MSSHARGSTDAAVLPYPASPGDLSALSVDFMARNAGVALIPAGTPVAINSSGGVVAAVATSQALSNVEGLALADIQPTIVGDVRQVGQLDLGTDQWDLLTGQTGGLTPPSIYYLSATAGKLTTIAPSGSGQSVTRIGVALLPTTMLVDITYPVLL